MKIILATIMIILVLPFYNGVNKAQAAFSSELLDQEIQRLKALDEVEQDDITLSFLNLIADCTKDEPNSSGVTIGCQNAVYTALSQEIEKQLGIDMETDNAWYGEAPRIQDQSNTQII